VPAEVKELVAKTKAGLADGSIDAFKAPLIGQDGKEALKKDAVADDKFLDSMLFYVKGVEGKVPNGK
jgi:simple sugar transport system substrate-binding protein